MNCPNCSLPMQEVRRYDVDIDYCVNCKGVWLDRGEIDKISNRQSGYDEEHYRKYHRERDYDDYDDDYYRYGGHRRRRGFLGDLFDFDQLSRLKIETTYVYTYAKFLQPDVNEKLIDHDLTYHNL